MLKITKICSKCGRELGFDEFYKKKDKHGVTSKCKVCTKEYNEEYRKKNKERMKENDSKYYKENKEKIKERHSKYYKENKEKIKEYRKKNKERIKERHKKYREENKERIKEYKRNSKLQLNDPLIKQYLGFNNSQDVPQEVIEIKRLTIKLQRRLRHEKQTNVNDNR